MLERLGRLRIRARPGEDVGVPDTPAGVGADRLVLAVVEQAARRRCGNTGELTAEEFGYRRVGPDGRRFGGTTRSLRSRTS